MTSEELQRDIDAYTAKGGSIQQLPSTIDPRAYAVEWWGMCCIGTYYGDMEDPDRLIISP